jgi:hypothetical protein
MEEHLLGGYLNTKKTLQISCKFLCISFAQKKTNNPVIQTGEIRSYEYLLLLMHGEISTMRPFIRLAIVVRLVTMHSII